MFSIKWLRLNCYLIDATVITVTLYIYRKNHHNSNNAEGKTRLFDAIVLNEARIICTSVQRSVWNSLPSIARKGGQRGGTRRGDRKVGQRGLWAGVGSQRT